MRCGYIPFFMPARIRRIFTAAPRGTRMPWRSHREPEYERGAGHCLTAVEREDRHGHPAVHAGLPCREREYVGFGGTAYRFAARERAFHAPDRGVLEPDAECQGQEVIHDPCPCQYASADGYGDEEEEPFADDIGQCTPRPAVERRQDDRLPTAAAPSSPAYSPSRPCLP